MEPVARNMNSVREEIDEPAKVRSRANPKQRTTTVDRVALGPAEAGRLSKWLSQVNESTNGFLNLSKSDLVNFLMRSHQDELTQKEIAQVCTHHYDPLRYIAWIAPQIKVALESGDLSQVAKLQDELRNVKLTSNVNKEDHTVDSAAFDSPRKRTKRKAKLDPENTVSPMEIAPEKE